MKNLIFALALCLLVPLCLPSQVIYNTGNSNLISNRVAQVATYAYGLPWVSYLDQPGITQLYVSGNSHFTTSNSGLPGDTVLCLSIDANGDLIVGTTQGLALTDGTNWTVWDTSNSPLPSNEIREVWVNHSNDQWWIATSEGIVQKVGTNWAVYDTSNSGIYSNDVVDVFASVGYVMMACRWGVSIFDGTTWINYDSNTVNFPAAEITCVSYFADNVGPNIPAQMVGSAGEGAAIRENGVWTKYDTANSILPSNHINDIEDYGGIYMSTDKGMHVYNPFPDPTYNLTTLSSPLTTDSITDLWPAGQWDLGGPQIYVDGYFGTRNGGVFTLETLTDLDQRINSETSLKIFPNPAQNKVRLQTKSLAETYEVLDISGRLLIRGQLQQFGQAADPHVLEISDLPNGFYMVRVKTEAGTAAGRFTIRR